MFVKRIVTLVFALLVSGLLSSKPALSQAPSPPAAKALAGWMSGTTMCIGLLGSNRDGSIIPKMPQGTGFVVSRYGYVLTNSHVVRPSSTQNSIFPLFTVTGIRGTFDSNCDFSSAGSYQLQLVAFDEQVDLALLKVQQNFLGDKSQWRILPLGDSNLLGQGDPLIVLGYANGTFEYNSTGAISATDTFRGRFKFSNSINHGNSGGPVLDARGYVVGIVWGGEELNNSANYFIPINFAAGLLRLTAPSNSY
jgi:serine protease Do